MKIPEYISQLLYEYECVVVPGLGGFIKNEHNASINRLTHEFKPPYTRLYFNTHLKSDDGLLVNYISRKEGVPFSETRQTINDFVTEIHQKLILEERIVFDGIGILSMQDGKNIAFEQDYDTNYNLDSFGLKSFVSPPIKREEKQENYLNLIVPERKVKARVDRRPQRKRETASPNRLKPVLFIAFMAILVLSISWGMMNRENVRQYWESHASLFPFDNTSPQYQPRIQDAAGDDLSGSEGESVESDNSDEIVSTSSQFPEAEPNSFRLNEPSDIEVAESEEVIEEIEEVETPEEKIPGPNPEHVGKRYYIIAGSFGNISNAIRLTGSLKEKGFTASIADTSSSGMFRVAYTSAGNMQLAMQKLKAIRIDENPEAWILSK